MKHQHQPTTLEDEGTMGSTIPGITSEDEQQLSPTEPRRTTASAYGTFGFDTLQENAEDAWEGFRLVDQSDLLGVPFAIIGVTYRNGVPRNGQPTHYISVECVCASQKRLTEMVKRGQINIGDVKVDPDEMVVFNDSGTGVCRAITQWLHDKGIIDVGVSTPPKPGGPFGESDFDKYHGTWVAGSEQAEEGFKPRPGKPLLMAPRGLRISEYVWDEISKSEAATYYIG